MRRFAGFLVAAVLLLVGLPLVTARADGAPTPTPLLLDVTGWERTALPLPGEDDGVGPGSYLLITMDDGLFICTANFVWSSGSTRYLGAAGHCFLPPDQEAAIGSNPFVDRVEVCIRSCLLGGQLGAVINGEFADLGEVVYARQHAPGDEDAQIGHDFGLVTIPASLASLVRPRMPVWGGPTGVAQPAGTVCMYGNGFIVGETFVTKARAGAAVSEVFAEDGWQALLPINSGDSGSAVNRCNLGPGGLVGAQAVGLVTHGLAPQLVPTAVALGTTVAEARAMVAADRNQTIDVVLAG